MEVVLTVYVIWFIGGVIIQIAGLQ